MLRLCQPIWNCLIAHKRDLKTCSEEQQYPKLKSLYVRRRFSLQIQLEEINMVYQNKKKKKTCRIVDRKECLLNKEMNTCHLWIVTTYKRRSLALLSVLFGMFHF